MLTIQARWFHDGRLRPIRVIVIHDMESPEWVDTAERCARYFATTDRKASAHVCVDSDSEVRCVDDEDTAFHAPGCNSDGLGIEHAGFMRQSRMEWLDDYGKAMLARSAKITADWCHKYSIPPEHLTVAELKAGKKGFVGHVDVSNAYGQTSHTDPGPGFPWDYYMWLVRQALKPPAVGDDDMTPEDLLTFKQHTSQGDVAVGTHIAEAGIFSRETRQRVIDLEAKVDQILALLSGTGAPTQ